MTWEKNLKRLLYSDHDPEVYVCVIGFAYKFRVKLI